MLRLLRSQIGRYPAQPSPLPGIPIVAPRQRRRSVGTRGPAATFLACPARSWPEAMEPLAVHAAIALKLLDDTNRAVALSLAGRWPLPDHVAGPVVQFAMAALPEAMATAEAAVAYARQRQDEIW